jgi:hypothetical protein
MTGGAFLTVSAAGALISLALASAFLVDLALAADSDSALAGLASAGADSDESEFWPSPAKNLSMFIIFLRKPHLASSAIL